MKSLIKSFCVFLILSIFTHAFLLTLVENSKYNEWGVWNQIINYNQHSDVVIVGSSRASQHFNTNLINTYSNLKSFNLGIDGCQFDIQAEKLKFYLKHNSKPNHIIISVDSESFERKDDVYNKEQFINLVYNKSFYEKLVEYNSKFQLNKYIPLYSFAELNPILLLKLFTSTIFQSEFSYKSGFKGVNKKWNNEFDNYKKMYPNGKAFDINLKLINDFKNLLENSIKNSNKVTIIFSPEYFESQNMTINREEIIGIYTDIAKKYDVEFINFSSDDISYSKDNFYNSQHMNIVGSNKFTNKIMKNIL